MHDALTTHTHMHTYIHTYNMIHFICQLTYYQYVMHLIIQISYVILYANVLKGYCGLCIVIHFKVGLFELALRL